MLKVLYLLNYAGKAGTEKYVQSLVEKLNGKHIKAFMAYNDGNMLIDTMNSMGVETYKISLHNPFDFVAAWKLAKLCKKNNIDLVHTQYLRENYIAIISRLFNPKVKVLWTNHYVLWNNSVVRAFNRIFTLFQAGIIAVCTKGKEMLIENKNSKEKINLIFNGVDVSYWSSSSNSTIREELKIDGNIFVVLCAARFVDEKGHDFLIKALAELKTIAKRPFICLLAGDGPLQDSIKKQVTELGLEDNIIFTGFRSDIKNLCGGSDIFINSSKTEALSIAAIEALATGLPIIATNVGGNIDVVSLENDCGILVEYGDCTRLANAINSVMEDSSLQERFRRNALITVESKFNVDKMVADTYNLYMKYCKNN